MILNSIFFVLGIIVGIGLSGIALYGVTRLSKPLETLFTVNPINNTTSISKTIIRPMEIIKKDTPAERALKTDE